VLAGSQERLLWTQKQFSKLTLHTDCNAHPRKPINQSIKKLTFIAATMRDQKRLTKRNEEGKK